MIWKDNIKKITKGHVVSFSSAIATLSSLATLITVTFPWNTSKLLLWQSLCLVLFIIIVAIFYSFIQNKKINSLQLTISEKLKLTIEEGNIFDKKGIIIIPVNEYFDTHVGDDVVDAKSIHGQFINKYYPDENKLNRIFDNLLQSEDIVSEDKRSVNGIKLRGKRYKLGTCIKLETDGNIFVLFSLTHFDKDNKANVSRKEYSEILQKLLIFLNNMPGGNTVYMPLFGTKFSRINRTPNQILHFIVNSIDFINDELSILGGLHIVIYNINEVNLNELKNR